MSDAKAAATKGPLRRTVVVNFVWGAGIVMKGSQSIYCEFLPDEVIVRKAYFETAGSGAAYYVTSTLTNDKALCMLVDQLQCENLISKHTTKGIQITGQFDFQIYDITNAPGVVAAGNVANLMLILEFVKH